ncbi:MAG: dihydrodipicolinate synthase family protein [Chloroflexi bacterium]|nr:dihydrodipicolinate synthase family protein [Chloroflexota bacterium]
MRPLKGICPAIVTPFDSRGDFDPAAMRRIVQHQLAAGVDGFYVGGGTGEGLLLTRAEREALLETVIDEVRGRALVIAHIGAFQTAETLALARHASDIGADAIAALPPGYFYRPDATGLVRYYTAVAEASRVPLLVYNIPQRTGIGMTRELLDRLLAIPNIVGMKDSSGNVYALGLFFAGGKQPVIFQGEDTVLLAGLVAGACGGIGATYNIMPELFVELWRAYQANDLQAAARTQARVNTIIDALLVVDLFGGIKQTLAWMGMPCGEPRTPNRPLDESETAKLRRSLESVRFFKER